MFLCVSPFPVSPVLLFVCLSVCLFVCEMGVALLSLSRLPDCCHPTHLRQATHLPVISHHHSALQKPCSNSQSLPDCCTIWFVHRRCVALRMPAYCLQLTTAFLFPACFSTAHLFFLFPEFPVSHTRLASLLNPPASSLPWIPQPSLPSDFSSPQLHSQPASQPFSQPQHMTRQDSYFPILPVFLLS